MRISRITSFLCLLTIIYFQLTGYEFNSPPLNFIVWGYLIIHLAIELFKFFKSKVLRGTLIVIAILVISAAAVLFVFIKGFGTKTRHLNSWEIENYQISHLRHHGWAGSPYEKYYLHKLQLNGVLIKYLDSITPVEKAACTVYFHRSNITFNKCEEKLANHTSP